MDVSTLARVMDYRVPMARYEELCPTFNEAMIMADCTTERRATMWCAQLGHESGGLLYMQEIADGSAYEWRENLGNNQPGDGRRFKGRGPIQVTGRAHYTNLSRWAYSKGYVPTPTFFVDNPDELAQPKYGFIGAVWYWTVERNMNAYADNDDLTGATRAVNGGLTNLEDRRAYWYRAGDVGAAILPTPPQSGGLPMDIPALVNDQLSGPGGQGWPILGPSKVDPNRSNTVVEAVAEIRDALVTPRTSLVEPEYLEGNAPAALDAATYARTGDYQAFHAARQAEQAVTEVRELSAKFDLLLKALGVSK